jgi:hypothetical protein
MGLLCDQGLIVIDFDDTSGYEEMRAAGYAEFFDSTAMAKTRKGFHVFGLRTPLCDELELYDGPLYTYKESGDRTNPMDLKTITNSKTKIVGADGQPAVYHTPGFCDVFPSPNKSWIRSVVECAPKPLPDALVRQLAEMRATVKPSTNKRKQVGEPRAPKKPKKELYYDAGTPFWRPGDLDVPCLVAMGFPKGAILSSYVYEIGEDSKTREAGYVGSAIFQFLLQKGVPCPLCGKREGHDNAFWVGHLADGSRRVKSQSPVCKPFYKHANGKTYEGQCKRSVEIPWTAAGKAGWLRAFRARGVPLSAAAVSRFAEVYQGFAAARDIVCIGGRLLVLTCDVDGKPATAVVCFGTKDAVHGYARAGYTDKPWIEPAADVRPIPVPISAFEELLRCV